MSYIVARYEVHSVEFNSCINLLAPAQEFKPEDIEACSFMIIEGSSFSDPGEDWEQFILVDKDDKKISSLYYPERKSE